VEPPAVEPPAVVLPPDVLPLVAPVPVVPPRLIAPDTLASELVPLLDPKAASKMLIAATRQTFRALDSMDNLITYSS
jgi:hypothetical protein